MPLNPIFMLLSFLLPLGMLVLFIWSLVWVYRDAQKRCSVGCLLVLLVFLTWPLGLILWVILRPEERDE